MVSSILRAKKQDRFRPALFAWYSAVSARRISSSRLRPLSGASEMPIETPIETGVPLISKGWVSESRIRRASESASSRERNAVWMTANSSPPKRERVSVERRSSPRRFATILMFVAGLVAVGVVDLLEAVEIEEHHREPAAGAPEPV